jgi:hypothetical protein
MCGNSFVAFVFVFTGLKTEIGLINDPYLWKVTEHYYGCCRVLKCTGKQNL